MGYICANRYGIIKVKNKFLEGKMSIKKASILITLAVLERESEYGRPISQVEIARLLTDAGIPCDRKTVGRDIAVLRKIGYSVKRTSRGFYMEQKGFTLDEIKFVINCVENSEASGIDKEDLKERLNKTLHHSYVRG